MSFVDLPFEILVEIVELIDENPFEFRQINRLLYKVCQTVFPLYVKKNPLYNKLVYRYKRYYHNGRIDYKGYVQFGKIISTNKENVVIKPVSFSVDRYGSEIIPKSPCYLFESFAPIQKENIIAIIRSSSFPPFEWILANKEKDYFIEREDEDQAWTWMIMDSSRQIYRLCRWQDGPNTYDKITIKKHKFRSNNCCLNNRTIKLKTCENSVKTGQKAMKECDNTR